ncbi:MAG TPA: HAD family hydrolase, partial [Acidobacteriaceae bacterium]|nr:HAD family hydrolase [Acidobacteriaceae bacterium]
MKISVRGILFDMDGVLVSSLGSVERSWTKWALAHGVDPAVAIQTAHGRRAIESVQFLRPDLDAREEMLRIEDMEVEDNEGLETLPGVVRFLQTLPPDRWAVVTSATHRLALSRLRAGGIPTPERLVSADQVTLGKPFPEPYLAGAKLLGLPPADCLVIEDSPSGATAGHAAGCRVLATLFSHPLETLSAADWIVRSLDDVQVSATPDQIEVEFDP